ncbi:MAG: peptide ABC transporter substrate-binding protein [Candidatus Eremiobacteraeota bacterium]|nr:peptide ABC transporter substrate-binding protein [Candidatus Eremiobacteraeota bacterium]
MSIADFRRAAAVALVAAVCAIASPVPAQPARNPWTIPGTLRVAVTIAPRSLNPILTTTAVEFDLARFCFDGLLATTPAGVPSPNLATEVPSLRNGGISRDGKAIRYRLRHGVRWHDGAPFTSRDVAFTWRAIMNPATNLQNRLGYDQVARVDTPDPYTVLFHMKRPFSPALDSLMGYAVVIPAHILEKYPDLNNADFNGAPVGTGPFKFVRWVRGDRIEYVAYDGYHLGKPRLQRVIVRIIPADTTAAEQVRAHEVDWYMRAQTISFRDLRGVPGVRRLALKQNAQRQIVINTEHPPLDDARVRRALTLAIDRRRLVDRLAFGTADPACGDLPPFSWAFDPAVTCPPFEPGAAARALRELGFEPGPDGVFVREGKRLSLSLVFSAGQPEAEGVAVQVQDMLKQAGVETEIHGYDPSMLFALAANGGILEGGRFDLDVSSFIERPDPDDSRLLTCDNRAPRGFNASRYCSPEMDAAQRESLAAFDPVKRKRAISKIEHLVVREAPAIYLWWPRELHVINSDLQGIEDPPGLASQLPYKWSI